MNPDFLEGLLKLQDRYTNVRILKVTTSLIILEAYVLIKTPVVTEEQFTEQMEDIPGWEYLGFENTSNKCWIYVFPLS